MLNARPHGLSGDGIAIAIALGKALVPKSTPKLKEK
jgi:hypothetical protein